MAARGCRSEAEATLGMCMIKTPNPNGVASFGLNLKANWKKPALTITSTQRLNPRMTTKSITLEIDAHDRLESSRRRGESFSEVVRRITLPPARATAAVLKRAVESGRFARDVNWPAIKRAVSGRGRSRDTRPAD